MTKKKLPKNVRERNGRYTYRYSIPDPLTGKRVQKETSAFSTPRAAEQAGIKILAEILAGTYVAVKDLSFSEWSEQWLELYAGSGKYKNKTIDNRRSSLKVANRLIGWAKLKDITRLQYEKMLADMKEEGYSKSSIELVHVACKMMFKKAVQLELIKDNITIDAEVPIFKRTVKQIEEEEDIPEFLEKEELAKLLSIAKEFGNIQHYHMLYLLAYTGMRIGELCALKINDIDFVNKYISITKTLYDRNAQNDYVLNSPKTDSSIRKIDFSTSVSQILNAQIAWRNEYKMSERMNFYNEEHFLFVNTRKYPGYPESSNYFRLYFDKMLQLANLPKNLSPHSLRHTFTSLMAEAGVELPAIQRLLGHKNDKITLDVYLHVTKQRKREAVDRLDALMNGLF